MHKFAPLLYSYMLAPTCFGSSLLYSGSFWIRLSYVQIQIDMVVYHIMWLKWPVCRSVVVPSVVLPSCAGVGGVWRPLSLTLQRRASLPVVGGLYMYDEGENTCSRPGLNPPFIQAVAVTIHTELSPRPTFYCAKGNYYIESK
jgi:hypothetical protein